MKSKSTMEEVIYLKDKGLKSVEIAKKLGVTINTVEKSLQLGRLHKELYEVLTKDRYEKLLSLKFKALDLKSIKRDAAAVIKFIDSIDIGASAKEIKEKLSLIEVRQEKVEEIKSDIANKSSDIEKFKDEVKAMENEYNEMLKCIDSTFKFILEDEDIKEDKKIQLLQSIAYNKKYNQWQFVGYVDYKVYKYLLNKKYIVKPVNDYDYSYDMVPVILDIEKFINYVKRSTNFEASFQARYAKRHNLVWANKGDKELKKITEVKDRLSDKKKELSKLRKDLKVVVNSDLNDFETVLEAKNELAKKDILKHNEIAIKGMKWLKEQGYIADIEYTHGKYRFDVIGVNPSDGEVVILEAKVSMSDFKQDKKVDSYVEYCNRIYVITDKYEIVREVLNNHNIMGCIYVDSSGDVSIYKDCGVSENCLIDGKELVYNIYNKLWSKIYKL